LAQADSAAVLKGGAWTVEVEGQTFELAPEELIVSYEGPAHLTCGADQGTFMALDTTLTPELQLEGIARDFNRLVQDQRKAAGLEISDRIAVKYHAPPRIAAAIAAHHDYLCGELLAEHLESVATPPHDAARLALSGQEISVALTRA
jgi:isoleucyl-tRNA synthetase